MSSANLSIALFAPIEGDLRDTNSLKQGLEPYLEKEAIKCFKCWRENAGALKDIPIYAICPTRNGVSEETIEEFKTLNVSYIEEFLEDTLYYECGFWNIPLVGRWAEENLLEETLIKIDLDMYLLKELPDSLLHKSKTYDVVGDHDTTFHKYLSSIDRYPNFFNTGFTITRREGKFFTKQLETLLRMEKHFEDETFESLYGVKMEYSVNQESHLEYCLLEEFCVSIMVEEGVSIFPFSGFYLETEENELTRPYYKKDNILFIHEHITNTLNTRSLKVKLQYLKELNNLPGLQYYMALK